MVVCGIMMLEALEDIAPQDLAREVEDLGFESLFFPEHSHIPCNRETIRFGQKELPDWYSHIPDPFIRMTAAAVVTERLKVGTCVCLIPEHDPIVLAKTVATLDVISGGRTILGIGAGWNAEELRDHGVALKDRWKVTRERVLAMKEIWTKDEAEYHGEFVDFPPMWCNPKPVQPGGPPVLMGAQSKWSWDRVAEYCDGWMPSMMADLDDLRAGMAAVRAAAERIGRDPNEINVSVWGVESAEDAEAQAEAGVERIIFRLQTESRTTLRGDLQRLVRIAASLG